MSLRVERTREALMNASWNRFDLETLGEMDLEMESLGMNLFEWSIFNNRGDVVERFLESGVDPNCRKRNTGRTVLHDAVEGNRVDAVRALLSHPNIDVNALTQKVGYVLKPHSLSVMPDNVESVGITVPDIVWLGDAVTNFTVPISSLLLAETTDRNTYWLQGGDTPADLLCADHRSKEPETYQNPVREFEVARMLFAMNAKKSKPHECDWGDYCAAGQLYKRVELATTLLSATEIRRLGGKSILKTFPKELLRMLDGFLFNIEV